MNGQPTFAKFQEVCVRLTKEQTPVLLAELKALIKRENDLQGVQQYILFPLRFIWKQPKKISNKFLEEVINCITLVLSKTEVDQWDMFQDMFTGLCLLLSAPSMDQGSSSSSEELKLCAVDCLTALSKNSNILVLEMLYNMQFLPPLGHAVSSLLNMAVKEINRSLRIKAMKCLMVLGGSNKRNHISTDTIGGIFASFLPGISMTLCKVITGDDKQGTSVTVCAIETWTQFVSLVLSDKNNEGKTTTESRDTVTNEQIKPLIVTRSEQWVSETAGKIKVLVERIVQTVKHDSYSVREALVDLADTMLQLCTKSLDNCTNLFLEVLVNLLTDDCGDVALMARTALQKVRDVRNMLEESLHSLTTRLPRVMRTADDEKKCVTLKLLTGYFLALGPDLSNVLNSYAHLKRLSHALVETLELDCADIKIVEQRETNLGGFSLSEKATKTLFHHKKHFKHFNDKKIYLQLVTVCRILGKYGNIQLLVDHFLDIFHDSDLYRKQAVLIINELMMEPDEDVGFDYLERRRKKSNLHDRETLNEEIIRLLIDEYLSPTYFDVAEQRHVLEKTDLLVLSSADQDLNSIEKMNSHILLVCLLLEGIGNFSKVLDFDVFLMDALYPILEKAGSENIIIRDTAYLSLIDISESCYYRSVKLLIHDNANHLMNSISLRLRHLSRHPNTPRVLHVMIDHGSCDLLLIIEDTIYEVLIALDRYHDSRAVLFMKVLRSLVEAVCRWYPSHKKTENINSINIYDISPKQVRHFFIELHKQRLISDSLHDDDTSLHDDGTSLHADDTSLHDNDTSLHDNDTSLHDGDTSLPNDDTGIDAPHDIDDNDTNDTIEPVTKKELPIHVKAVVQVLERCVHLLSDKNPRLRMLVLDTVAKGCTALEMHQDDLLPMVHNLWSPLVQRFTDNEILVSIKAFETLATLVGACGDFVRQRISKDVLPKVLKFLEKQSDISKKSGTTYKYTGAYKYQYALLNNIGDMCVKLNMSEANMNWIVSIVSIYIDENQTCALKEAAKVTLDCVAKVNPDLVWYQVTSRNNGSYQHANPHFKDIQV